MAANKLFGLVLMMLMVHFNTAERKPYSKPSSFVPNITDDEVPLQEALRYTTTLNVNPFPYLPDLDGDNHRNLLKYIRDEFNKLHPNVLLTLGPMNVSDDFYDTEQLIKWLNPSGNEYDVVEVDTILLGDLVDAGVVAPQYLSPQYLPPDWHPAAASAVQVNGEVYAYPHLICAILLFTRDDNIAAAVTPEDLVRAIQSTPSYQGGYLAGNLNSSWDITALYLDSYRESTFPYDEWQGIHGIWSDHSLENLRRIAQACNNVYGENHCLDGYFADNYDLPAKYFGLNQVKAMYGYPERLHYILKYAMTVGSVFFVDFKIKPLPLGDFPNQPLFFTDAYVFRRNMPDDKFKAAQNFVEFMATPRMQAAVAAIEETAKNRFPYRYLLPMSRNAYYELPLNADYFYLTFFKNLTGASLPNRGFNKLRGVMKESINTYLSRKFY